jgi:hypothetical protein
MILSVIGQNADHFARCIARSFVPTYASVFLSKNSRSVLSGAHELRCLASCSARRNSRARHTRRETIREDDDTSSPPFSPRDPRGTCTSHYSASTLSKFGLRDCPQSIVSSIVSRSAVVWIPRSGLAATDKAGRRRRRAWAPCHIGLFRLSLSAIVVGRVVLFGQGERSRNVFRVGSGQRQVPSFVKIHPILYRLSFFAILSLFINPRLPPCRHSS